MIYKCEYERMKTHVVDTTTGAKLITLSGPFHWKLADSILSAMNIAYKQGVDFAVGVATDTIKRSDYRGPIAQCIAQNVRNQLKIG